MAICRVAWRVIASILIAPTQAGAQTIEVAPFGGYRFGGGFFEQLTGQSVDLDGARAAGAVLDIRFRDDFFIEGSFTHQVARFSVPARSSSAAMRWRITVDHWQGGGLRELREVGNDRVRPFLTGALGLTRYATEGDSEVRFSLSAGGGLKLLARRFGLRLDGRVYGTFLDIGGRTIACTPGFCLVALDTSVIWQAEFTAGALVRF